MTEETKMPDKETWADETGATDGETENDSPDETERTPWSALTEFDRCVCRR